MVTKEYTQAIKRKKNKNTKDDFLGQLTKIASDYKRLLRQIHVTQNHAHVSVHTCDSSLL